jgi:hypothetical protein
MAHLGPFYGTFCRTASRAELSIHFRFIAMIKLSFKFYLDDRPCPDGKIFGQQGPSGGAPSGGSAATTG